VYRAGSAELMDLGCVPDDLRYAYKAKLANIHQHTIETEIASIDALHIIDVLSQLQMELKIYRPRSSVVVIGNAHACCFK
jgi:hypothetical protein